jgi:hypothetical protein
MFVPMCNVCVCLTYFVNCSMAENQILLVVIYSLSIPSIVMVDVPICGALVAPVSMCTNVLNCYQASFLGLDKRMMFPTMNPSVFLNGLFKRFELTCDNHLCINHRMYQISTLSAHNVWNVMY